VALSQKYPYDPDANRRYFPSGERTTAEALIGLQLGAGIAFWATVLWGIIDAHVLYKPETLLRTRELPRGPVRSLSVAPMLGPAGSNGAQGGLSFEGRF
jgi:hypothetical protein